MPTSLEQIEIERETIGHALKDRRLYVPVNQRSYKWEDEHVTDLYQDLARAIADGDTEYFLGSIVVVRSQQDRIEVNDGQQRLATSMILIAAARDNFIKLKDEESAAAVEHEYLISKDRKTHELTPRLHLNAEDHDYFVKRILLRPAHSERAALKNVKPTKPSHRRINKAAEIAARHINSITSAVAESEKPKVLHRWIDFLEEGARVIWVQVADERTAYFIFETMNDRGLKLSSADLLKNYIFAQAGDRKDEAFQKWQAMVAILDTLGEEEDAIVSYIRYLWISNNGLVRSRDLYDEIKKTIRNKTTAITLASELENRAQDYAALATSSHEMWATYEPSVRKQIDTLTALGSKQLRPVLLAAMTKFTKKQMPKVLHACICWTVRCLLSGVPTGTLERAYGRAALKVTNGEIKNVEGLTSEMLNVIPDDDRFRANVATVNVSQAPLARYYLRALQLEADGDKEPQYVPNDGREVTLEHILPEEPGTAWKHIQPDVAKAFCNKLGNQVLLAGTVNSKLGNAGYGEKKPALKASPFSLTKAAAKFSNWDVDSIQSRQSALAKLAVRTWPLKFK